MEAVKVNVFFVTTNTNTATKTCLYFWEPANGQLAGVTTHQGQLIIAVNLPGNYNN